MNTVIVKRVLNYLGNIIYPCCCPYCGSIINQNEPACTDCKKKLNNDILITHLKNSVCISPFKYDGIYKKAINYMKFNGHYEYAEQMAMSIYKSLKNSEYITKYNFDYITYVPFTKKEYKNRGYNQSKLLAEYLSLKTGIKMYPLLIKIKDNNTQHELSAKEREINVIGVFKVNTRFNLSNKQILLVDDICTTGATLNECANVLLKSDCQSVLCATYSRTI